MTGGFRVWYSALLKAAGYGRGASRDLSCDEAKTLFGAMLDGGIPDFELGALLMALRAKGEAVEEIEGAAEALAARTSHLDMAWNRPPVIIPSYGGAKTFANLTPLLALLLRRFEIPVLIHGELDGHGRVATAYILRELGILPSPTLRRAESSLARDGIAFVPVGVLSPGLAQLLSLRNRLGLRHLAHQAAKLLMPVSDARALTIISASRSTSLDNFRMVCARQQVRALILAGTEGEPFADPRRRPQIDLTQDGMLETLFGVEAAAFCPPSLLPPGPDAISTAKWIEGVLAGVSPLPVPLINQLACCLYGVGYADDMNQAKAIVAVETGTLATHQMRGAA